MNKRITGDSAKIASAKKNGALGGRRKKYKEITAYDSMVNVCRGESWKVSFMDFVDGFRRQPSWALIKKDPIDLSPDTKMYALLQSICIQLCFESETLVPHGWLVKRAFLPEPWFVSGMKSLYAAALQESPVAFRKNNIFVMRNFLNRV